MSRLGALIIVVAACAGSREVSKIRYTSTDCPDPNGCGATLATNTTYEPPDEAHDRVADAAAPVAAPSCNTVAVALVALELGNYASEEDERAALHAKHRQACEAAKLDARETACMSTVSTVKHVGYCTRKMGAPTQRVPILSEMECKELMVQLRPLMQSYGYAQNADAYEMSCIKDGWSSELGTCFQQRGYYDPMSQCRAEAPGWVFEQIQARIDKIATK